MKMSPSASEAAVVPVVPATPVRWAVAGRDTLERARVEALHRGARRLRGARGRPGGGPRGPDARGRRGRQAHGDQDDEPARDVAAPSGRLGPVDPQGARHAAAELELAREI